MPIRERPFYNPKRRSVYTDYNASLGSASMHSARDQASDASWSNATLSSSGTANTICRHMDWSSGREASIKSASFYAIHQPDDTMSTAATQLTLSSTRRLYTSRPNRTLVCTKAFAATRPGELQLRKGDIVHLLAIGDAGYWEGRLVLVGCFSAARSLDKQPNQPDFLF